MQPKVTDAPASWMCSQEPDKWLSRLVDEVRHLEALKE